MFHLDLYIKKLLFKPFSGSKVRKNSFIDKTLMSFHTSNFIYIART